MPGTSAGAKKAAKANRQKDPNYYKNIGKKGGSKKTEKTKYRGFGQAKLKDYPEEYEAMDPEVPEPRPRKIPGKKPKHVKISPNNVLENENA